MQNPSNIQSTWQQGANKIDNQQMDSYGIVKIDNQQIDIKTTED